MVNKQNKSLIILSMVFIVTLALASTIIYAREASGKALFSIHQNEINLPLPIKFYLLGKDNVPDRILIAKFGDNFGSVLNVSTGISTFERIK